MFHDGEMVCSVRTTVTRIHIKLGDSEAPAKNIEDTPRATSPRRSHLWPVGTTSKSIKVATKSISLWPLRYRFDQVPTKTNEQKQTDSKQ